MVQGRVPQKTKANVISNNQNICWYHFIHQARNKPCYTAILLPNDPNSLSRKGKKVHAGSHKRERKKIKVIKSQTCSKIKVRCFIFFLFSHCIKLLKWEGRASRLLGDQWSLLIPMQRTKERWAPRPNVSTAAIWKDKKYSGVSICMYKVDIVLG